MKKSLFSTLVMLCLFFSSSFGQNIIINDNPFFSGITWLQDFNDFTPGNAQVVTLSPATIQNADQIYIFLPQTDFSTMVTDALAQALVDGKRIVLVGDNSTSFSTQLGRLNAVAAAIGAQSSFDLQRSSGAGGCSEIAVTIEDHPLTQNVTSPLTASLSTSAILMGSTATSLIKADFPSGLMDIAIVEQISNGEVVFYGDTNLGGSCNPNLSGQTFINNLVTTPITIVSPPMAEELPIFSNLNKVLYGSILLVVMVGLLSRKIVF